MKYSSLFSLNVHDLIKGAIMAGLGAAMAIIEPLLTAGVFTINWQNVWHMALGSAVIDLIKNFLTPPPRTIEMDPNQTVLITK